MNTTRSHASKLVIGTIIGLALGTSPSFGAPFDPEAWLDAIEMKSPLVLYEETGGLLAVENRLAIDATGRIVYVESSVAGTRTFESRIPEREVALLDALFAGVGFEKMPAEFRPKGIVMDGVTFWITHFDSEGRSHRVRSETQAVEPPGFTILHEQILATIQALTDAVVLTVKVEGGFVGERRLLEVKANGSWSYRCERPGVPDSVFLATGVFPVAQMDRLANAMKLDSFMHLPTCYGGHDGADFYVTEITYSSLGHVHSTRMTEASSSLPRALLLIRASMERLNERISN